MYMPTTTHILSDETGQLILEQLQAISQALDDGALTNTQIDTVLADQSPTGAGFLDGGGLKRFFDGLQVQIDALEESVSVSTVSESPTTNATRATSVGYSIGKLVIVSGVGNTVSGIASHEDMTIWQVPDAIAYQTVYINIYGYRARAFVSGNKIHVYNDEDTKTIPSGSMFNFVAVYVAQ